MIALGLLAVQVAILVAAAKGAGWLAKKATLPAVVGELSAGILLGPTLLGRIAPDVSSVLFPGGPGPWLTHLATLGMVLLMLLTGLQTDVRDLRRLGRASAWVAFLGLAVPFALGVGLGFLLPDSCVAQPEHRSLFACFLGAALAITALPVMARILADMGLIGSTVATVSLTAGAIQDGAVWIVLAAIAAAASSGETTLAGAHAALAAFAVGVALRQIAMPGAGPMRILERTVFLVLGPVFFGVVGLRVDLGAVEGIGLPAAVLGVACVGKVVGSAAGARVGGLSWREAFSVASAMNARGAVGLVVASAGLSLGILNGAMYSIVVLVAVATSLLAPVGLRLAQPRKN